MVPEAMVLADGKVERWKTQWTNRVRGLTLKCTLKVQIFSYRQTDKRTDRQTDDRVINKLTLPQPNVHGAIEIKINSICATFSPFSSAYANNILLIRFFLVFIRMWIIQTPAIINKTHFIRLQRTYGMAYPKLNGSSYLYFSSLFSCVCF